LRTLSCTHTASGRETGLDRNEFLWRRWYACRPHNQTVGPFRTISKSRHSDLKEEQKSRHSGLKEKEEQTTSNVQCRTSNVQCRTSNVQRRTSNAQRRTSNNQHAHRTRKRDLQIGTLGVAAHANDSNHVDSVWADGLGQPGALDRAGLAHVRARRVAQCGHQRHGIAAAWPELGVRSGPSAASGMASAGEARLLARQDEPESACNVRPRVSSGRGGRPRLFRHFRRRPHRLPGRPHGRMLLVFLHGRTRSPGPDGGRWPCVCGLGRRHGVLPGCRWRRVDLEATCRPGRQSVHRKRSHDIALAGSFGRTGPGRDRLRCRRLVSHERGSLSRRICGEDRRGEVAAKDRPIRAGIHGAHRPAARIAVGPDVTERLRPSGRPTARGNRQRWRRVCLGGGRLAGRGARRFK